MKSRVRLEIVGQSYVDRTVDYPGIKVSAEVLKGLLTAITVEVDHDQTADACAVMNQARDSLRDLLSLVGLGTGQVPMLGNCTIREESPNMIGIAQITGKSYIVRRLNELPAEELFHRIQNDPRLRRQLEHLNAARANSEVVTRIRCAYQVLEQEQARRSGYQPTAEFRHIRNAVSHPELGDPNAKTFFQSNIGADVPDLGNERHVEFLASECGKLLKEAERIVENKFADKRFWQ